MENGRACAVSPSDPMTPDSSPLREYPACEATAQMANLPVFSREKVGCMHWGLVNGKTQTHLSWGWRPGKGEPEVWQHDLYANDHSVYDENEIDLFRKYIRMSQK